MMQTRLRNIDELSQAVRELRNALRLTQQGLATRLRIAVRTVARWENDQPPRGHALVQLAQLAQAKNEQALADKFVQALQRQWAAPHANDEPELKGWLDGLQIAFRYRLRHKNKELWRDIAEKIIAAVECAARDKQEVSEPAEETLDLYQHLKAHYEEDQQD
jgi:transcriptional regulator with XRE-family HTH domain